MSRMERFNALGRGTQVMLVGAVLLFIDLFFTWQDSEEVLGTDVPVSLNGWEGIGVLLGILTIVLLAWIIVRLASVNIPLPVSTAMTAALIGTLILILAVIKILTILGNDATIWAWIGLALAVAIAIGAFQTVQEAGGIDTLKSEMPGRPTGSTMESPPPPPMSTPPPATTPEAAPPAAEPPPTTRPEASSGPESPSDVTDDDRQA
jgi:hypothetical protein